MAETDTPPTPPTTPDPATLAAELAAARAELDTIKTAAATAARETAITSATAGSIDREAVAALIATRLTPDKANDPAAIAAAAAALRQERPHLFTPSRGPSNAAGANQPAPDVVSKLRTDAAASGRPADIVRYMAAKAGPR